MDEYYGLTPRTVCLVDVLQFALAEGSGTLLRGCSDASSRSCPLLHTAATAPPQSSREVGDPLPGDGGSAPGRFTVTCSPFSSAGWFRSTVQVWGYLSSEPDECPRTLGSHE